MKEDIKNKIEKRSKVLFIILIAISLVIAIRLIYMQVFQYDYYQERVIDNIQQETSISADRGLIYDRNMNVIATNVTTYRVFISPSDIESDEDAAIISENLSEILGVDYNEIYERTQKKNRKDETIKKKASEDEAELVRKFKSEYKYNSQIYLEATSTRYYPYGSLAANVIGAMGTDGGLFGVELQYNDLLTGKIGKYITTKNAQSKSLPFSYDYYIEAENGLTGILTLDMTIQSMLESQLKAAFINSGANNGVAGIVMDVNTGGILAMGQYPTVDLNSPYVLNEIAQKKYDEYTKSEEFLASIDEKVKKELTEMGILDTGNHVNEDGTLNEDDEYTKAYFELYDEIYANDTNEYYWTLVYKYWNNKTVSELYEPGSTFKVVTSAMAIETGVTKFSDRYSCSGYYVVAGNRIKCHCYPNSHGTADFATQLQNSCNPTLMQVAQRIGNENFYKYFQLFGYTSKTGIDLPGEAAGLYVDYSGFNAVELACYSFGQTFKTTMIQQITAVAAVANGGYLVTPHVVSSFVDSKGNTVISYNTDVKRQVVASNVGAEIMDVLEKGVSGNGGAKSAYVAGYKIAAKTGTSEKRDVLTESLRVCSTVAIAPSDNPQVAALIIVDEPEQKMFGSSAAAPFIANLFDEMLPYLGFERVYSAAETSRMTLTITKEIGKKIDSIIPELEKSGIKYEIVGSGDTVTAQVPSGGTKILETGGKLILYTSGISPSSNKTTVPNVVGMKAQNAIRLLQSKGLNVVIKGTTNYAQGEGADVISQSVNAGTSLDYGSVVSINCRYLNDSDDIELEIDTFLNTED